MALEAVDESKSVGKEVLPNFVLVLSVVFVVSSVFFILCFLYAAGLSSNTQVSIVFVVTSYLASFLIFILPIPLFILSVIGFSKRNKYSISGKKKVIVIFFFSLILLLIGVGLIILVVLSDVTPLI